MQNIFLQKRKCKKDEKYLCKSLQFQKKGLSLHHRSNEAEGKQSDMKTATFETGKTYEMRFIGDSDLRPTYKCTKRTATTATFQGKYETITRKVKVYDGEERVLLGSYSMAPEINAKNIAQ